VVGDTRGMLLDDSEKSKVHLLLPRDRFEERPLLVRTAGDSWITLNVVSGIVRSLDPNLVVYSETLDDIDANKAESRLPLLKIATAMSPEANDFFQISMSPALLIRFPWCRANPDPQRQLLCS
jgi:hypothetical protein